MDDAAWTAEIESLRAKMEERHTARERALSQCRALIQTASRCIRQVHRNQWVEAEQLLLDAKAMSAAARKDLAAYPELLFAGYLQDAEKEMVEAAAVFALVQGKSIPRASELGVGLSSYLNGLGEASSECRRYVLDAMRAGNMSVAEQLLHAMETIYDDLTTFDYPDSLTGGLRRTCDALRAVIERTRSDLTLSLSQQELLRELQSANMAKEK